LEISSNICCLHGAPIDAELEARKQSALQGKPYVPPYNDLDVIAGQGTLGVELAEQAPDLDAVFISVGDGGDVPRQEGRGGLVWPQHCVRYVHQRRAERTCGVTASRTIS
jgi:hypothetical protein